MVNSATHGRFEVLDGLRGVAAVCVMLLHFWEPVFPDAADNMIPHGYMAVDFFFCLSGYVLAFAYDGRRDISVWQLIQLRLIRLHPMVIIATLLCLVCFVPILALTHQPLSVFGVIRTTAAAFLMVPDSFFTKGGPLFLYTPPAWSLFSEYLASFAYALILWRLSRRWLIPIVLLATIPLMVTSYAHGMIDGGWEMKTIEMGVARVAFSFTLGVLLFRYNFRISSRIGFLTLGALLLAILLSPHPSFNWYYELAIVMLVFPIMIGVGAGATASPAMGRFCEWMGNLSYPLYLTHYAFVHWFTYIVLTYHPSRSVHVALVTVMALAAIALAQIVLVFVDTPVRAWLKREMRGQWTILRAIRTPLGLSR
jgi:peptidoglycan/LPS O-acetylase OafA/YrhL